MVLVYHLHIKTDPFFTPILGLHSCDIHLMILTFFGGHYCVHIEMNMANIKLNLKLESVGYLIYCGMVTVFDLLCLEGS